MHGENLAISRIYRQKYGDFPAGDVVRRYTFPLKIYPHSPLDTDYLHFAILDVDVT